MSVSLLWFRRDLRLHDSPALLDAAADGRPVAPVFVVDPALWGPAGLARRAYLARSLRSLDADLDGRLHVLQGDPVVEVVEAARRVEAESVHVSADFGPYGAQRDARVEVALAEAGIDLVRSGSAYAVAPGRVVKADGTPYRVFTPFYRAWVAHGWRRPAGDPSPAVTWLGPDRPAPLPEEPDLDGLELPAAGEAAARQRWADFRAEALAGYAEGRNRPDRPATSRLSPHLRWGEIHPRTLLADLGEQPAAETFRRELAWREFYADVLHQHPSSARTYLRPELAGMRFDRGPTARARLEAWQQGRTGYPLVDAGMRQLLAEGWMHNRVRMVVASFLVKDLHLEWTEGARWFMQHLVDGDLASNAHGWQWTAGTGTDAAPYYRVFNPVGQGLRFDPDGDYVRRYVPELRTVPGPGAHEPWTLPGGPPPGYPARIVDHAAERAEALDRYREATGG